MAARIYNVEDKSTYHLKVYFRNPKTKEVIEKTFKDYKEAQKYANDLDFDFYYKNKEYLPEGISVEKFGRRFRLFVRLENDKGVGFPKIIFSNKSLIKVIEARSAAIKTLTGINRF